VPYIKPALTYATQIQQLKNRGLIINSDPKALHLLTTISYYRLSGYWYPMLSNPKSAHIFKPRSTLDNAFRLYCFDRELRKILTGELEKIEVAIRAKMIYTLSHRHGPFWYTNPGLFSNAGTHSTTLISITKEFNRTDEKFITDFKLKYNDPLPPSWMMLEVTSFGTLSMLYKNLASTHDRRDIARDFGLDDTTFESWVHSMVYVRNVCAHHSRLWNRVMRISPNIPTTPRFPWISITTLPNPLAGGPPLNLNNRLYFILSMVIYLLNTISPNQSFKRRLRQLLEKYPNVSIKAMGFPIGWKSEPLWDWKHVTLPWYKKWIAKLGAGLMKIE